MTVEQLQTGKIDFLNRALFALPKIIHGLVGLLVLGYISVVLSGHVDKENRLGTTEIGLLLVVVLLGIVAWRPELLKRGMDMKVVGIELKLDEIKKDNKKRLHELEDFRLIFMQVNFTSDLRHLENLSKGDVQHYVGWFQVRLELRRLRALGYIEMLPGRFIGEFADGKEMDLSTLVRLTERGKRVVMRLQELGQDDE
jgi:hypothetical protein